MASSEIGQGVQGWPGGEIRPADRGLAGIHFCQERREDAEGVADFSMDKVAASYDAASSTVHPASRILSMMEASQHHDVVGLQDEEEGVGEATEHSLPNLTMGGGERSRESKDSGGS